MWETLSQFFSALMIPAIVLVLAGVLLGGLRAVSRLYTKVAPNVVAVVFGRKKKSVDGEGKSIERGYRVVKMKIGGVPLAEDLARIEAVLARLAAE